MPRSEIVLVEQKVEINDVTDIVISEIIAVGDGTFVREIKIVGTQDVGIAAPLTLVIRVVGASESAIEISTPSLNY